MSTSSISEAASSSSSSSSASAPRSHFDELRWVIHVKTTLETMVEEAYARGAVSIFSVPKILLSAKPEAYIPQLIALGPYHHWDPQLYQMEHYKLAIAKRTLNHLLLRSFSLHQVAERFVKKEHAIRSCYHRHLELQADTLAWMMVIDASFLLEFLRYLTKGPSSMSRMVDLQLVGIRFPCNVILRDIVMLENQIPLFLVRKLLKLQCSSIHVAEDELSKMLLSFLKAISPFTATQNTSMSIIEVKGGAHLLQLLYCIVVPKAKDDASNTNSSSSHNNDNNEMESEIIEIATEANDEHNKGDPEFGKKLFDSVWSLAASLHLMIKPIEFLLRVPWSILTAFFGGSRRSYSAISSAPPLTEEIEIPSVAELVKAGVKFSAVEGYVTTIVFDAKTATFCLPAIRMDAHTEVVLRNLVAYETTVEAGPLVFTRYTELMNGIIDTREDVSLLRQAGVVTHRMKNDEEVAKVWNGMSRSVRLTKVEFLDKVIADVNGYHKSKWSVTARRFVKDYVRGSWQVLTVLAAILLLLLTFVDVFCTVFRCNTSLISPC